MILVAENNDGPYRFLRCDHSLLGGRWLRPANEVQGFPTQDGATGMVLDESIYSAFIVQEAVRLAVKETRRPKPRVLSM